MKKEYHSNKVAITINLIIIIILFVFLVLFLFRNGYSAQIVPLLISALGFFAFLIYTTVREYKSILVITDETITSTRQETKQEFRWKDVDRVIYKKFNGISCFESLIVQCNGNRIVLNTNISNYKDLCKVVVNQVYIKNPKARIDPELLNRFT